MFSANVGTAAGPGDEGVVVVCAYAVSGVTHSSRSRDMRTMLPDEMTGEKPANEICVVIDSGEPSSAPPCVNAMSSGRNCGTLGPKQCSSEVDQNMIIAKCCSSARLSGSPTMLRGLSTPPTPHSLRQYHFEGT